MFLIRLIRVNLMVYFVCRENTQRRLEFAVNTVLVMVPPPEKSSRRWKSRSTLNTDALSAERTRKLSFLFAFFQPLNVFSCVSTALKDKQLESGNV
jgi:hypothetical protein